MYNESRHFWNEIPTLTPIYQNSNLIYSNCKKVELFYDLSTHPPSLELISPFMIIQYLKKGLYLSLPYEFDKKVVLKLFLSL